MKSIFYFLIDRAICWIFLLLKSVIRKKKKYNNEERSEKDNIRIVGEMKLWTKKGEEGT